MAVEFDSIVGVTFTFDGDPYTATQISVSRGAAEFDVTSTAIPDNGLRRFRLSEVQSCDIKVDWVGLTIPPIDAVKSFTISGGTAVSALYATGSMALCTGLTITAQAGELIKGSATFKVSYD
jgi:hypothetical protein